MTEYLGKLIYAQPTSHGFLIAMLDTIIMAVYLLGMAAAMGQISQSTTMSSIFLWFAISLVLFQQWMGCFMRLTHPNGNYEYRRKFVKEDGTVREMVGVDVYDSEWDE